MSCIEPGLAIRFRPYAHQRPEGPGRHRPGNDVRRRPGTHHRRHLLPERAERPEEFLQGVRLGALTPGAQPIDLHYIT